MNQDGRKSNSYTSNSSNSKYDRDMRTSSSSPSSTDMTRKESGHSNVRLQLRMAIKGIKMLHVQRRKHPLKDVTSDVQAKKDSISIISTATLIPIKPGAITSLEQLVVHALNKMFGKKDARIIYKDIQDSIDNHHQAVKETIRSNQDTSWMIGFFSTNVITSRRVSFVVFEEPTSFGPGFQYIRTFSIVICPSSETSLRGGEETALTVATHLSDSSFHEKLRESKSSFNIGFLTDDFLRKSESTLVHRGKELKLLNVFSGLSENFTRRLGYYPSDILDGIRGDRTIAKVISSSLFLFFLCVLPTVAFGVLNAKETNNKLDVDRALVGQAIGGLLFAIFSGQPFVIIATTAPMALCTAITFRLSQELSVDFYAMYACVGLFNCLFLVIYGVLGITSIIAYSRRCVEEIFLIFSFVCFMNDAFAEFIEFFRGRGDGKFTASQPFLFILLLLGTSFSANVLYGIKFTRLFNRFLRDTISDYALPLSVVAFSIIGYFMRNPFLQDLRYHPVKGFVFTWKIADVFSLNLQAVGISIILGFAISILFFMDQGISAQLINTPTNNLKKGNANDLDFVVVALINVITSLFGLPMMHGLLPHCPLHVVSLADFEERLGNNGQLRKVVTHVRETRLAAIICHGMIAIIVYFCPFVFALIPVPVLNGLFFYCAIACLRENSFFDRILLLVTQQSLFPPTHYIRRCPRWKVHAFTIVQLLLTIGLVFVGFCPWPLLKIWFPVVIAILIPMRHVIFPKFFSHSVVKSLDSYD